MNHFLVIIVILLEEFYIFKNFENMKNISKYRSNNIFMKKTINTNNSNNFAHILPRINLDNKTISTIEKIFKSRVLFISSANLTGEYIRYIRPINETEEEKTKKYSEEEIIISPQIFKKRKNQYDYIDFANLCLKEKLIDSNKIKYDNKPLISIILPSYNKEKMLLKSIRSIQNQSFKNIEIIIVNDCSTDNSKKIFEYLLETDPRIRIFHHLKNMGAWRSRLDGILYSRGKYIIAFDIDDLYEDNYILEDIYNLMEKYNLDSLKFLFRVIKNFEKLEIVRIPRHVEKSKVVHSLANIKSYDKEVFKGFNCIWNRIVRNNTYIKGLYLINDVVLNIYKNAWEDGWQNFIIDKVSNNFTIIDRIGYIYFQDGNGEGMIKTKTEAQKDKMIKEFLGFL